MHVEDELIGLSAGVLCPLLIGTGGPRYTGRQTLEVKMLHFSNKTQHTCSSHIFTLSPSIFALTDSVRHLSLYWAGIQPTEARETKMDPWEMQY